MIEHVYLPYMDSSLPELYTWEALLVPIAFTVFNLFALVPSAIIMIAVLRKKSLHTTDNFMTLQMVLVDIVFAIWALVWFPLKLATDYRLWNFDTCQMEGSMILICGVTWVLSGTFLGFYRYRKIIGKRSTPTGEKMMISFQYFLWVPSIVFAILISLTEGFRIMPSFGYCYLLYIPGDEISQILLWSAVGAIMIPVTCVIYFYWSITAKYHTIVRHLNDAVDPVYLPAGNRPKGPTTIRPIRSSGSVELTSVPRSHLRRVAMKCIIYSLVFIISFLTMCCTILYELFSGKVRGSAIDSIAITTVLFHKIMSPVITLWINDTLNLEMRILLGFTN